MDWNVAVLMALSCRVTALSSAACAASCLLARSWEAEQAEASGEAVAKPGGHKPARAGHPGSTRHNKARAGCGAHVAASSSRARNASAACRRSMQAQPELPRPVPGTPTPTLMARSAAAASSAACSAWFCLPMISSSLPSIRACAQGARRECQAPSVGAWERGVYRAQVMSLTAVQARRGAEGFAACADKHHAARPEEWGLSQRQRCRAGARPPEARARTSARPGVTPAALPPRHVPLLETRQRAARHGTPQTPSAPHTRLYCSRATSHCVCRHAGQCAHAAANGHVGAHLAGLDVGAACRDEVDQALVVGARLSQLVGTVHLGRRARTRQCTCQRLEARRLRAMETGPRATRVVPSG